MKFSDIVKQTVMLLQQAQRITYRALKREFSLDDEALEDLKEELRFSHPEIADEEGRGLVWVNEQPVVSSQFSVVSPQASAPKTQPPIAYTPAHLAERIRAATITDGERKTITALFADLKGSTALIEGLDPEEARAIIDPALQLMMDAVHRYEGYVAQALGDGIFALFGAPIAHEDHPQRALYAALRMQEEMRRYGDQIRLKHGVPLAMRVGLNTGEVVVRSIRKDDLHTDYVPVGHSTNLAARMEQMATPGSILVTAYTHRLTEGYFAFNALGQTQIKGVEEPLNVYEVLGAGPLRTRLQVSATLRGLTRFVGRQSELEQLQRAVGQAQAGHGQIVGVMGEPGLGKSRLFHEFTLLSVRGGLVLEAYSVSHGKASAYLPVIELLKRYFRIEPRDDERTRREKVGGKVLMLDRSLEDTLPYLFALLGIEEQPSPLQQMDPQIRRRRTFEALKKLFLRESLNQPLILIFEDLHWIDNETQGFLDTLGESVASAKILLLVNYRPEYRHEWGQKTYYTQLRLAPFGKAEAEEFLDELLGTIVGPQPTALRHTLKQLILAKADGTPFFMEEIVQELRERNVLQAGGTPDLQIPPTVHGVLAARIDRLAPDEKALLQQLAVIGREFPLSLLRRVIAHSEEDLYRLLSSLQHKEFLYEQPAFPEVEYLFKHALTQEVAYNSVLQERRKELHEQVAQAIEALWPDQAEERCSELAYHYRRSGNMPKAITYLHHAGQQALGRSAYTEAIDAVHEALVLLTTQPDSAETARQELALQVTLGLSLRMAQGLSAEVEKTYARAQALCERVGEPAQLFSLLSGVHSVFLTKGDFHRAQEVAQRLWQIAQDTANEAFLVQAYYRLGVPALLCGEFSQARGYLEQCLQRYDPEHYGHLGLTTGSDVRAGSLSILALALWCLGFPDQGRQCSEEALRWASQLSHLLSYTAALHVAAEFRLTRGDIQLSQELAEQAMRLATEQGLPSYAAQGECARGSALIAQGRVQEGIASLHRGIEATKTLGTRFLLPRYLAGLGQAYASLGQTDAAGAALSEALAERASMGEHYEYDAEIYRVQGELTLAQSSVPGRASSGQQDAEEYFRKALEIAQRQQAKSLELRAVMSLARLWQQQDKIAEAHALLSEIYHWFTEGFDTKDLQEAKALLAELSEGQ